MARRIAVRGIICKNEKLFGVQQKRSDGSVNDFWSMPGGGLEEDEGIRDGLRREIIEETGVVPEIGNLLFIQQFMDDHVEQFELMFHIKNADDFESIDLATTSHGVSEIERSSFVDPKSETVLPAFLAEVKLPTDPNVTLPVQTFSYL